MGRAWPALDIHVPGCDPELHDLVLAELDDFQPSAIQGPPLNEDGGLLRAFFSTSGSRDGAARALAEAFRKHLIITCVDVDDEDWAARSQADLQPITVGRLTIYPEKKAASSHERGTWSLFIKPSMGFGTGHHATTRLMIDAMQRLELAERTVLDVGCGSAVLAIAAVRLGARSALAVDIDPDALTAAAENLELNEVAPKVTLRLAGVETLDASADIVLANLTGSLIERAADELARLVSPGGHLIVSGVMESESTVIPAVASRLAWQQTTQEQEWLCASFARL